jgi:Ca-activated chloride channel homolog
MSILKSRLLFSLLVLSLINPSPSLATGWIMIDPALSAIPHIAPHIPTGLFTPPPNINHPPLLKGNVSLGLRMQSQDIKVSINDQVARTYIKQIFANDSDRNLAGTYLFPLPADTTFSSFSLHIDGKPVEGKILEAQAARQEYEEIVRRMVDPGLLEYADYKTVRARIFPIPAHGVKTVELEYTQLLKAENGMLKYSYPLRAEGQTDNIEQIKLAIDLTSKQGLRSIWSPSHQITLERNSNSSAKVNLLEKDSLPDKDFLLCYSVSDKDLAANLLTHRNPDEDGYFLLTLAPPLHAKNTISKDIVFVVDTSGSMQGEKIEETKRAVKGVLKALNADDRFAIIQFNTDIDYFKAHLQNATDENRQAANKFVDELEARGGTNISYALQTGCGMLDEISQRPAYIILMTDGQPTVGETSEASILKGIAAKRNLRIFDFGVGYDVNTRLLNKLAEEHHGTSQYVAPSENLEIAVSDFYKKIASPFLTDIKIEYSGIETKDVYPREVKDIFAGSQVMLLGKYKSSGKCIVNLSGKINGVEKSYSFPLSFQSEQTNNTYLPRLWAMRRIGYLTDIAHDNGNNREVIDEVVSLSKKYGIITEFTSFLATDPSETARLAHNGPTAITDWFGRPSASPVSSSIARKGGNMRFQYAQNSFPSIISSQQFEARMTTYDARMPQLSGAGAVERAKDINALKQADYLAGKKEKAASMKSVADKTFYLNNEVWVDSVVDLTHLPKIKEIVFASREYFDLIHSKPSMAKYLSIGKQIILQFEGQVYKIIMPKIS